MRSPVTLTRSLILHALALFGGVVWSACAQEVPTANFAIVVHAADELGLPLAGVQLSAAGVTLGETDAGGQRELSMPGQEGQRVDLAATCPAGYTGPRERPSFLLRHGRKAQGGARDQPLVVNLTCAAHDRVALVVIHASEAGLPIMLRGQTIGQTSATGTAHVMLREAPGTDVALTLDTTAKPELRPRSPSRVFLVTQQDAFAVWDQGFEAEKRSPGARRRRRSQSARSR